VLGFGVIKITHALIYNEVISKWPGWCCVPGRSQRRVLCQMKCSDISRLVASIDHQAFVLTVVGTLGQPIGDARHSSSSAKLLFVSAASL
jgi:hypothetical protein